MEQSVFRAASAQIDTMGRTAFAQWCERNIIPVDGKIHESIAEAIKRSDARDSRVAFAAVRMAEQYARAQADGDLMATVMSHCGHVDEEMASHEYYIEYKNPIGGFTMNFDDRLDCYTGQEDAVKKAIEIYGKRLVSVTRHKILGGTEYFVPIYNLKKRKEK